MSWRWVNAVRATHGLTAPRGADRLCLLLLAEHVRRKDEEAGVCWPSQRTLAGDCNVTERAVRGTLARLDAAGYITREPRGRGHRYRLNMEALEAATPEAGFRSQDGDTGSPLPENTGSPAHDTGSPAHEHRKPASAQPSENNQSEQPTEPAVGRSLDREDSDATVTGVVARMRAAGEGDPGLPSKVAGLVRDHGAALVSRQLAGLERQYEGKDGRFGYGALLTAVKEGYQFSGPRVASLVAGGVYSAVVRGQALASGVPKNHLPRCPDDERGRPQFRYNPNGVGPSVLDSLPDDARPASGNPTR